MKRLVVTADDFGWSEARNRGIIECVERGIVTSVSLLANFSAAPQAMEFCRKADVGIGVHLDLTEGRSLTGGLATLTGSDGRFLGKAEVRDRARKGVVDPSEAEREMEAQVARVIEAGLRATHLDGHQHIHVYGPFVGPTVRVARRFGIRWIRCPLDDDLEGIPVSAERRAALAEYEALGRAARQELGRAGLRSADHFRGAALAHQLRPEAVEAMLRRLPEGITEYMTHPGYAESGHDFSGPPREEEVRILTDPGTRRLLGDGGIELTHFGRL